MSTQTLQLYAAIGSPTESNNYQGIDATAFKHMLAQAEATGEKTLIVRINSGGGSWVDGQSMYAYMQASPLKIDTAIDGIAASSATLPFMAGRKRLIAAHARLMIHNCSSPAYGGVSDLEQAIEQQKQLNESMAIIYANTTGLPLEQIREMMAATTWLNAEQAVALGFATGIIATDKKAPALEPTASLAADGLASYTASLADAYALHLPSKIHSMKAELFNILAAASVANITADADDTILLNAVTAAFSERDQAKLDLATAQENLTTAQARVAELELEQTESAAAAVEAEATQVVATAITEGRILAGQKDAFLGLAKADLTNTKAALAALPARPASLIEQITADATGSLHAGEKVVMPLTAAGVMAQVRANLG